MSDFITLVLPMREDPLTRVFAIQETVSDAIREIIKKSHRDGDPYKKFNMVSNARMINSIGALSFKFSMYPEQGWKIGNSLEERDMLVIFNYCDGGNVPNLAFSIKQWGQFRMIFDTLTEAFLDQIDRSRPVVRESSPGEE